jgi:hypothetical protein
MFSDSGDACSHPSLMIAACCLSFVLVFIPRDILGIKASSRVIVAWMAKVRSPMLSGVMVFERGILLPNACTLRDSTRDRRMTKDGRKSQIS